MMSKHLECCAEKEKDSQDFLEAHCEVLNGKLIATMQVCLHCGRKFSFKQGRKYCPYCQCLL